MKKTIVLKTALFLLIFGIVLSVVYKVIVASGDYQNYQMISCFYEEQEKKLDAVYIGGSSTYVSWEAPIAWNEYGIAVYPFASNAQPLDIGLYMVKEARKTQPNALYIINISGYYDRISDKQMHWLLTYLPFSMNRIRIINTLCDVNKMPFSERLEYYFPLYRFHSRWKELKKDDFHYTSNGLKGSSQSKSFLEISNDVTSNLRLTTRRSKLRDSFKKSLEDLLDYCDEENMNVLFVFPPQVRPNEDFIAKMNTIIDLVRKRGYPCLNMLGCTEEIGLDFTTDYYNGDHTNIHGALKTTRFLAKYLKENYKFRNKKGEAKYSDWAQSYNNYMKIIRSYALDIETNFEKRDYTMAQPVLNKLEVNDTTITVSWAPSASAEGYRIYRKEGTFNWKVIGEVKAGVLKYIDKNCLKNKTYTYTVVPWRMIDGKIVWGKFDVIGVQGNVLFNT